MRVRQGATRHGAAPWRPLLLAMLRGGRGFILGLGLVSIMSAGTVAGAQARHRPRAKASSAATCYASPCTLSLTYKGSADLNYTGSNPGGGGLRSTEKLSWTVQFRGSFQASANRYLATLQPAGVEAKAFSGTITYQESGAKEYTYRTTLSGEYPPGPGGVLGDSKGDVIPVVGSALQSEVGQTIDMGPVGDFWNTLYSAQGPATKPANPKGCPAASVATMPFMACVKIPATDLATMSGTGRPKTYGASGSINAQLGDVGPLQYPTNKLTGTWHGTVTARLSSLSIENTFPHTTNITGDHPYQVAVGQRIALRASVGGDRKAASPTWTVAHLGAHPLSVIAGYGLGDHSTVAHVTAVSAADLGKADLTLFFVRPGTYAVSVKAKDRLGQWDTVETTIQALAPTVSKPSIGDPGKVYVTGATLEVATRQTHLDVQHLAPYRYSFVVTAPRIGRPGTGTSAGRIGVTQLIKEKASCGTIDPPSMNTGGHWWRDTGSHGKDPWAFYPREVGGTLNVNADPLVALENAGHAAFHTSDGPQWTMTSKNTHTFDVTLQSDIMYWPTGGVPVALEQISFSYGATVDWKTFAVGVFHHDHYELKAASGPVAEITSAFFPALPTFDAVYQNSNPGC